MNYNITGRKLQNFSQSDLLQKLIPTYGDNDTEKQIINDIRSGICYMLSIEWIRRLFEQPNAYPDSIFDPRFDNEKTLYYYKQIADNYCKFYEDYEYTYKFVSRHPSAETFERDSVKMDARYISYCFKNDTHQVDSTTRPYNSSDDLRAEFQGNNALLLYVYVKPNMSGKDSFAHEMAIWNYNCELPE